MNPYHIRIGFEEAIGEKLLFKRSYERLTDGQRVILRAIYGLPLTKEERILWNVFNGCGVFDALGFLDHVEGEFPYFEEEAQEVTLCLGRRSGKTSAITSFIAAYEAICGGHKAFVGEKQDPYILQVAQDLMTAKSNLRQFILEHLELSKIGKKELGNIRETVTADQIRLGGALITVGPPTIKLRGQAVAICLMDELAFWPKDKDSANPDYEVERAVRPAMKQFPFKKIVKASTPWTEEGLIWEGLNQGSYGHLMKDAEERKARRQTLVLRAPTAMVAIKSIARRDELQKERVILGETAFRREYLAEPQKSVTGFLNPVLVRASVTSGVFQRKPIAGQLYVATIDPAFRRDAFALAIGHLDESGNYVSDFINAWRGTAEQPLSPGVALATCARICREYGVSVVTSDQYHQESLQEIALKQGLVIEASPLTNELKKKMWGDVIALLHQSDIGGKGTKLKLLDHQGFLDEFLSMEQVMTPNGNVQYRGKRDDMAMAFALNVHRCLWFGVRGIAQPVGTLPDPWVFGKSGIDESKAHETDTEYWKAVHKRTLEKVRQVREPDWWVNN